MKILIATPLYPPDDGGPATRARILELALPPKGVDVEVVSFSHFRHLPKGVSHLFFLFALLRRASGADLLYALDPVSVGLPALIVATICRKPLALCIVGDYAWEQGVQRFGIKENLDQFTENFQNKKKYSLPIYILRFIERTVAQHSRKIIVPSAYLHSIVMRWGIDSKKIVIVYNSFLVDLPSETKDELKKYFATAHPTVISVGRFVPWKGFTGLMDAMALVRKSVPDALLEIAGSGDDAEYRAYAKEKGYDFVRFLGLLDHSTLMRRISAADCFALNTAYEGLSHVILEAMALRTPVVTTDVGGNPELFASHARRWLAHYDEREHIASLIGLLLLDPASAKETADASADYVATFTEERMIAETITALNDALV